MESRYTIIGIAGRDKHGKITVLAKCSCGTEKVLARTLVENGRIRSCGCLKNDVQRQRWDSYREPAFWSRVDRRGPDDCWEWTGPRRKKGPNNLPYGVVGRRGVATGAHRVAWELANGPIPLGSFVLHKCDNCGCCNPKHLYLGDHDQNMQDMVERHRRKGAASGETNGRAKLTQVQADEIRAIYAAGGRSQQSIADEYGVSQFAVSAIIRNKRYAT